MPKHPVYTDSVTKKANKKLECAPTQPELLPLHPSQAALAERVTATIRETGTALIVGKKDEPGLGKTRVAGKAARDWLEREKVEGRTALTIFVAKSAKLAHEQAAELGAIESEAPWRMHLKEKLIDRLEAHKMWTVMFTRTMLNKLVLKNVAPFVELVGELGIDSILVVVDEAHELYKNPPKLPAAMSIVRRALNQEGENGVKLTVVGVTATPDLGAKPCRDGAKTLFSVDEVLPPPMMYTEAEHVALCDDHKQLPAAPINWETIDLKSPVGEKACEGLMVELHQVIVDLLMAPTEGDNAKMAQRGVVRAKLAELCAKLAHDPYGGALIDVIKAPVDVRIVQESGVLGDVRPGFQAALVAHKSGSATQLHCEALEATAEDGSTELEDKLTVIDLGAGALADHAKAAASMLDAFRSQETTTVGFVSQSQHSGHNDFAKLASTIVAVGSTWSEAELRQLFARVGRMCTPLQEGDVVPLAYRALHLDCEWAKQVAKIDEKREGLRGVKLPKVVLEALDSLKKELTLEDYELEEIELNVKKLVSGDAFMATKGKLALKYISAEAAYHRGERNTTQITATSEGEDE